MQFITTGNRIMTENFTVGLFYTITFNNENILACACNGVGDNFVSFLCVEPYMQFILDLSTAETIDTIELYGGGAGTMNYNELTNKPEINGHVLSGNQLPSQLGLATAAQGELANTAVQPADLASYQTLIDSDHKLPSDLIDDTLQTNKFATQSQLDQIATNAANISSLQRAHVSQSFTFQGLTWSATGGGVYVSNGISLTGIDKIESIIITGFNNIRTTDVITPLVTNDRTQLRFMSNVTSFAYSNSGYTLYITGTPSTP